MACWPNTSASATLVELTPRRPQDATEFFQSAVDAHARRIFRNAERRPDLAKRPLLEKPQHDRHPVRLRQFVDRCVEERAQLFPVGPGRLVCGEGECGAFANFPPLV